MNVRHVRAALVAATPVTGARGSEAGGALCPIDSRQRLFGTCRASSTAGWVMGSGKIYAPQGPEGRLLDPAHPAAGVEG